MNVVGEIYDEERRMLMERDIGEYQYCYGCCCRVWLDERRLPCHRERGGMGQAVTPLATGE